MEAMGLGDEIEIIGFGTVFNCVGANVHVGWR